MRLWCLCFVSSLTEAAYAGQSETHRASSSVFNGVVQRAGDVGVATYRCIQPNRALVYVE